MSKNKKWKLTMISGVAQDNNMAYVVEGTVEEASQEGERRLKEDNEGDSPEYMGFSVEGKFSLSDPEFKD